MFEMMKEQLQEMLAEQELFDLTAQVLKKMHDEMVKAGFTESQATTIVAGQGLGNK